MKVVQVQFSVCVALLLLPLFFEIAIAARTGAWQPVNPKDPHVVDIGKYAIDEHNRQAKSNLKFKDVIDGESQVVSGINYRLVIEAAEGKHVQNYEAVVWEKAWEGYRNLTSFHPLLG